MLPLVYAGLRICDPAVTSCGVFLWFIIENVGGETSALPSPLLKIWFWLRREQPCQERRLEARGRPGNPGLLTLSEALHPLATWKLVSATPIIGVRDEELEVWLTK